MENQIFASKPLPIPFDIFKDKLGGSATVLPFTPPAPEETVVIAPNNAFLNDLRDFMNEFAETDLNIDGNEEPTELTKAQANFYVKLYQQVLLEEEEMNSLCDSEIDRVTRGVNKFREERQKGFDSKKKYFESILSQYAAAELDGKKAKTVKLPYGNLSFKKQQPKISYADEAEIIRFLKENNDEAFIKSEVVEKLDKASIKKAAIIEGDKLILNGVELPEVEVEVREDRFEIK